MRAPYKAILSTAAVALLGAACAGQPAGVPSAAAEEAAPANGLAELSADEREAMLAEHPVTPMEQLEGRTLLSRYPPGANVRVYTREQLRNTGATNLGEALERLDPRIRVE